MSALTNSGGKLSNFIHCAAYSLERTGAFPTISNGPESFFRHVILQI